MKQYEGIEDTWGCFRVYDVTSANEIYFEVDWYRATGFGGVAKLKDGIATFDIQYGETKLKGYFTISDDAVALNLEESTLMVGSGVYKYNYNTGVYRDSTLAGYGTLDHNLFISYLEKNNKSSDITWEFLGSPGEIFFVTGAEYPGSFDLYKVTAANGAETYYACLPYDYQAEYGVYQIGLNGTLQFVWKPLRRVLFRHAKILLLVGLLANLRDQLLLVFSRLLGRYFADFLVNLSVRFRHLCLPPVQKSTHRSALP